MEDNSDWESCDHGSFIASKIATDVVEFKVMPIEQKAFPLDFVGTNRVWKAPIQTQERSILGEPPDMTRVWDMPNKEPVTDTIFTPLQMVSDTPNMVARPPANVVDIVAQEIHEQRQEGDNTGDFRRNEAVNPVKQPQRRVIFPLQEIR